MDYAIAAPTATEERPWSDEEYRRAADAFVRLAQITDDEEPTAISASVGSLIALCWREPIPLPQRRLWQKP